MPFKLIKWTISLTIIFLIGYYILIPSSIYLKEEGIKIVINKIKKRKNIKNFIPEEIYVKLPEQLKNVKISKNLEEALNLANLIKENKITIAKAGTGLYFIGRESFKRIWSKNELLTEHFFDSKNNLDDIPKLISPFDPKLVNSIIEELKKIDYER